MKLSDFQCNYIARKNFDQNFQIFERNGISLAQIVLMSDFLAEIWNHRQKIDQDKR